MYTGEKEILKQECFKSDVNATHWFHLLWATESWLQWLERVSIKKKKEFMYNRNRKYIHIIRLIQVDSAAWSTVLRFVKQDQGEIGKTGQITRAFFHRWRTWEW